MNPRTRQTALYAIGVVAVLASVDALGHSYAGLYEWAVQHRLSGWQAISWPAEIDVFLVAGELALYVAYLDRWPARQRVWPWMTAVAGLVVSVAGNIGHVQALPGAPVTAADRVTAAVSPIAAFAGLMIGLLVLKMNEARVPSRSSTVRSSGSPAAVHLVPIGSAPAAEGRVGRRESEQSAVLADAVQIARSARLNGERVSQRMLAAHLRGKGHRFSNAQLRDIAKAAYSEDERAVA